MEQKNKRIVSLFEQGKRLLLLYFDDLKLATAEKLTILLSAIAVFVIIMVFAALFIVFAAIAITQLLESVMDPFWAFMIVALFFLLAAVLFFAFRTEIIINPMARFISELFVDPPTSPQSNNNTDPKS